MAMKLSADAPIERGPDFQVLPDPPKKADAPIERGPDFQVLPDPPKKRDMLQEPDATYARGATRARFEELREDETRGDAVVRGEGYLRVSMDTHSSLDWLLYPDLMVAFGVDARLLDDRHGYVIEDHGKPPAFVMEIASKTTGRRDVWKRVGYAALGVHEYFMFDRTGGDYHDAPVWGGRLVDGRYEPIPIYTDEDGVHSVYSETLRLEVCWVEEKLRFRDPIHGGYLHTHAEAISAAELQTILREAAEDRAQAAERARREAEERADAAEGRADAAESARREAQERAEVAEAARQVAETARRAKLERAQAAEAARQANLERAQVAEAARQANLERAQAAEAARQANLERAQASEAARREAEDRADAAQAEIERLMRQIRGMRQDQEGADEAGSADGREYDADQS